VPASLTITQPTSEATFNLLKGDCGIKEDHTMETVSLELKLPSDLLPLLRKSREEMEQDAQLWVVLELFRRREISAGKAAELAGLSLSAFMDATQERGIPWISYTDEELEKELLEAEALGMVKSQGER
jgi:predicted HTH domain antitoxin